MKYLANDGKVFDNETECVEYEKKLAFLNFDKLAVPVHDFSIKYVHQCSITTDTPNLRYNLECRKNIEKICNCNSPQNMLDFLIGCNEDSTNNYILKINKDNIEDVKSMLNELVKKSDWVSWNKRIPRNIFEITDLSQINPNEDTFYVLSINYEHCHFTLVNLCKCRKALDSLIGTLFELSSHHDINSFNKDLIYESVNEYLSRIGDTEINRDELITHTTSPLSDLFDN